MHVSETCAGADHGLGFGLVRLGESYTEGLLGSLRATCALGYDSLVRAIVNLLLTKADFRHNFLKLCVSSRRKLRDIGAGLSIEVCNDI